MIGSGYSCLQASRSSVTSYKKGSPKLSKPFRLALEEGKKGQGQAISSAIQMVRASETR